MALAVRSRSGSPGRRTARATPQFDQRPDVDVVVLRLPVPVSVNDLHAPRKGGGVKRSAAYEAWLKEAGWRLAQQRPGRISGRYCLTFWLPRSSGLDLDNGIKATSDLLQLHGVIRNDRDAEEIHLLRQDEDPEAIVEVRPASEGERA